MTSLNFLELPGKLRNHIYGDVFDSDLRGSENLTLLLRCRQIYREAKAIGISKTVFQVTERQRTHEYRALPDDFRNRITTIELLWTSESPYVIWMAPVKYYAAIDYAEKIKRLKSTLESAR